MKHNPIFIATDVTTPSAAQMNKYMKKSIGDDSL